MHTASGKPKAGSEWVAALLRDRIVKGELAPRARIIERRISAELGVSRTPVREADGLVEISHHRGAVVLTFLPEDAAHLFDVISVLESRAAQRLAERMTSAILERLEDLHGQMLDHHDAGRFEEYFDVNTVIHDLIVDSCGNPVISEAHARLIARARRGRFLAIMDPERLAQAVSEHERLIGAFRACDASGAAAIWETHLRHTGETLVEVLRRQTASYTTPVTVAHLLNAGAWRVNRDPIVPPFRRPQLAPRELSLPGVA